MEVGLLSHILLFLVIFDLRYIDACSVKLEASENVTPGLAGMSQLDFFQDVYASVLLTKRVFSNISSMRTHL